MTLGDADDGMRIVIGGFGRFVFAGTALTGQLINTERIVDVVRISSDGVPVRGRTHVVTRRYKSHVLTGEATGSGSCSSNQRVD